MVPSLRSGELATRPLPGLLLDLHDGAVSGSLTLRRAGMVKMIELGEGELVRVTSSLRDETLGHFLVARGAIDERVHRRAVEQAARDKRKLGEVLVELGAVSARDLESHLVAQDRHKLVAALRWPQGTWRFDAHSALAACAAPSMPELVVRGLAETGGGDGERLRRFDGAVVEVSPRGRELAPQLRDCFGPMLTETVLRGGPVANAERLAGDKLGVRRAVEVLVLCGGASVLRASSASVEVTSPHLAQGEPSLPRGMSPRRSDPMLPGVGGPSPTQAKATSGGPPRESGVAGGTGAAPEGRAPAVARPSSGPLPSILRGGGGDADERAPAPAVAPARRLVDLVPSRVIAASGPSSQAAQGQVGPGRSIPAAPSQATSSAGRPSSVLPVSVPARLEAVGEARPEVASDSSPTATPAGSTPRLELAPALASVPTERQRGAGEQRGAGAPAPLAARPASEPVGEAPTSSRATTRREAWVPRSGTSEGAVAMPRTITSAARSRTWTPWPISVPRTTTNPLYELLFDELHAVAAEGSSPLMLHESDSGVVTSEELGAAAEHGEAATEARRALVAESERIRTADLYTVLMVERTASAEEISAALSERQRAFSREYYARFALGLDRPRLDEVLATYAGARNTLLDDDARRAYDRALGQAEAAGAHSFDAEIAFRDAEDLVQQHRYAEAITLLEGLTARAPAQADFHDLLGWVHWLHVGPSCRAGDLARPHLARALTIDPEHVAAHVHRAIIGAALGEDDAEVMFHLERALELAPARADALDKLGEIMLRRGDLRRLERTYKRVLFRLGPGFPRRSATLWLALAQLYAYHLDDPGACAVAVSNAETIAAADPQIAAEVARLRAAAARPLHPLETARARLRRTRDLDAAAALIRDASEVGQPDSALVTAATMVALGTADARMQQTYERYRVVRPSLPEQQLTAEHWGLLRHPDDFGELGALLEPLAPAVVELAPVVLADAGVEGSMLVTDAELPEAFARVRAKLAALFGVPPPPVFARPELERHVELLATEPPVLVAGDEALTAPERPELVCRLARALCNAPAGRAVGGSRSKPVLRAMVLAAVRDATSATVGEREPLAAQATAALMHLAPAGRAAARAAALRLLARASSIDLSHWARSLPRTADRAGLVLCQDIPTALAIAKESGVADRDLIEFAFSAEHVALRDSLGLALGG